MATLGQVGELITTELHERVDRLVSAVEEDSPDFAEVSFLADAVGELADEIAMIYSDLEQTLIGGLQRDKPSTQHGGSSRRERQGGRSEQRQQPRQQHSEENGSAEDTTKEELLERARDVNVHGRSSMSKEELAQAVEAEESQTKEELLERARQAEIEGRSAMSKDELRKALTDADA
jgi:hypothetical protein